MELMEVVKEQRTPTWTERIALFVNVLASVMAVVPMVMVELKPLLPEHYYGGLSSVMTVINTAIFAYLYPRQGKIVAMKPVTSEKLNEIVSRARQNQA